MSNDFLWFITYRWLCWFASRQECSVCSWQLAQSWVQALARSQLSVYSESGLSSHGNLTLTLKKWWSYPNEDNVLLETLICFHVKQTNKQQHSSNFKYSLCKLLLFRSPGTRWRSGWQSQGQSKQGEGWGQEVGGWVSKGQGDRGTGEKCAEGTGEGWAGQWRSVRRNMCGHSLLITAVVVITLNVQSHILDQTLKWLYVNPVIQIH